MPTNEVTLPPSGKARHGHKILNFVKTLDGSRHPALDQTAKASVAIEGIELSTGKLNFKEKSQKVDGSEVALIPLDDEEGRTQNHEGLDMAIHDSIKSLYAPCCDAETRIVERINKYQAERKTEYVKTEEIRSYDWQSIDDPLTAFANSAVKEQGKYEDKSASGFWGHVRGGGRWFSENTGNGKSFVSLVPADSMYTSVLCGGLTLHLHVAKFLGRLSVLIETNHQFMDAHRENMLLHECNVALCVSILEAIEAAIEWFHKNPTRKIIHAMRAPRSYGREILDKIDAMDDCQAQFKGQVEACLNTTVADMARDVRSLVKEKLDNQHEKTTIEECKGESTKNVLQVVVVELYNEQDVMEWYQAYAEEKARKSSKKPKRQQMTIRKAESLMKTYRYDGSDTGVHEHHSFLQLRYTMATKDQDRAVAMMRDPRIQSFAGSEEPCRLLVHGNGSQAAPSPISFVSTKLAVAFENAAATSARIILLSFFCGLHTSEANDPSAHPPGMLLAMLLQLIQQLNNQGVRINSAGMQREIEDLDIADVHSIGKLLRKVEEQVPSDYVLCIIVDAVSCFEDGARRSEMKEATRVLLALGNRHNGPIYKLLMTAPLSTVSIWKTFGEYDSMGATVMEVPSVCVSRGGFSALEWENLESGCADGD